MKKKIKKNRLKIFIALSLMFTLITTIFIGTKTFAYESDKISYTITQLSNDDFTTYDVINNNNNYIDVNYTNNNYLYVRNDNNFTYKKYYLCINYIYLNENNEPYTYHSVSRISTTPGAYINNQYAVAQSVYYNNYEYNYNGTYYTQIIPITFTTNWNNTISKFRFQNINGHIRIYNIDIVSDNELGLPQYYETYYAEIENQYEQLQNDFEQLEDDYYQLNNDYTDLEQDYNELEENYNDLESNYNELSSNNQNGIWSEIKSQVCFADNYGYFGYTLEELLQNNFVNALDNNIIMDAYTRKPYATNFHTTLNFYRNDGASNATTFVPLSLLSFRVNSNVNYNSVSTFIRIDAMNIDNLEQGTIPTYSINITPQILQLFEYEITFDKIANYFNDINFNYYNALGFINVYWNKRAANDYITFTSLNDLFSTGYISGYQQGAAAYVEQIKTLEQQIKDLNNEITSLNLVINSLNEQIRTFNTDYNLNNLMWTIGSTPFESFKHIWNVNFLGVNLADFVLGFITTFIGIWILKKFFI